MKNIPKTHLILFVLVLLTIVWSVIGVADTYLTWILEAAPALVGLVLLVLTYNKFRMPTYLYVVMAFHMVILLVGAHYSYAKVPLGFWMEDWFGFTRNNYDKIGHFMQGVTPALLSIEVLQRMTPLKTKGWTAFLSICVAEAFSALYEIIEWLASLCSPTGTEAFLGTQGYIWDTQSDMLMCFIGAIIAAVVRLKFPPCKTSGSSQGEN
jgi:putative membrane protein